MSLEALQKELAKKGYNIKVASQIVEEKKFRTGIFALDYLLGGGISIGEGGHRIEFFGAESTAKTTFALKIISEYQKAGKSCAFVDGENSYDKEWGHLMGVDNETLLVIRPTSLEQLGDMLYTIVPQVDLVVIDSIVSFIPEMEIEKDTNEPTMALQARVNALITRKLYSALSNVTTTMIFINQMREKVGVMYGSPNTTGGGHALKHLYNTRIEFKVGKPIEEGTGDEKERIGHELNMRCVKNKKGVPNRVASMDFYYADGSIDNNKTLFYAGLKTSCITTSGHSYIFKDTKIVGKDNFLAEFKDWKDLEKEIWKVLK